MTTELLSLKDVETRFYTYAGIVKALEGVNLTIMENEWFGLIGETGCGKSVTAFSIMRMIPSPGEIVQGEIIFEGQNLLTLSETEMEKIRGSKIAMIFQDPSSCLNPSFRIIDQVKEPIMLHQGMDKREAKNSAAEILRTVGITPDYFEDYPHQLSGGMKQRVMIATALSCRPKLIIADEPTSNLDVTVQAQILELMKDLQKQFRMSVLLITHNLGLASDMCSRLAVMYAGRVIECSEVAEFFAKPKHPYSQALVDAVPTSKKKEWLNSIPGSVPNLLAPPPGCRFHPRCKDVMSICSERRPPEVVKADSMVACYLYDGKSSENG